jgi:hypothetical protein
MKIASFVLFAAAAGLSAPAMAAPAPAPRPSVPATAANVDDFGCMVRTLYMAGAAEDAGNKATDQTARDSAIKIATENYEAASFFIGKLSVAKPVPGLKQRFEAEVATFPKLGNDLLSKQISQCVSRAQTERAAYVSPLAAK